MRVLQGTVSSWLYCTSLPFCDLLFQNSTSACFAQSGNPVRPSAACFICETASENLNKTWYSGIH